MFSCYKNIAKIRSKTKKTIERFYKGIEEIYLPLLTIGILIDSQEDKVLFRGSKADAETGDAVLISSSGEGTSVLHQHFADKNEADALSIGFGGEERAK